MLSLFLNLVKYKELVNVLWIFFNYYLFLGLWLSYQCKEERRQKEESWSFTNMSKFHNNTNKMQEIYHLAQVYEEWR